MSSRLRFLVLSLMAFGLCLAVCGRVVAQELDASLNETVVNVPKKGAVFTVDLETTVYKPDGDGPFPLVVINHGKAYGDSRFQSRYRPALAARWFMQRGYVVVVPMRQGFSKSSGSYIGGGCNVESNGRAQAEDVKAVLDYFVAQPYVDKTRMLVMGQSHGGWTTLALGTRSYPGVKGLVNFAGGLRQENCSAWEGVLASAAGSYGNETTLPSLWFYGDNDSYFTVATWKSMFERYTASGGKARVVAFGTFGGDSHAMFGSRTGQGIWQPEVNAFLEQVGLPNRSLPEFQKYGRINLVPAPARTDFALLDDTAGIPFIKDSGREAYKNFLSRTSPKAFAIAPNSAWGWAEGGDDPLARALQNCNLRGKAECKLYAVDADVVWKKE
jgi:dienelactone hydrolase